ncbi:hypothetical protein Q9L58_010501 [Maublancomyces gigas]|uniref:Reverse transcriptase n=1 Tax=Discina gigas TaxID=1032678 RepID=A0ABR3G3Y1_9PEZI
MSHLEQADAPIIWLHTTVEKQTRAINSLTTTLQDLRRLSHQTSNKIPLPSNGKGKSNATPNANDKNTNIEKKKNNTETVNDTPQKTYANVAATNKTQNQGTFTKVSHKKKAPAPFFTPEYSRLNRQVMVETNGPIPDLISNDDSLEIRSLNGNLRFETNPSTSADEGAKYHVEITLALDKLHIQATNIYANSRWSKFVIYGVPAHIGTKNSVELSARIADEIFAATNFSMAQPPKWLTSPEVLQNRGNGMIIISFRGKVKNLSIKFISLFNRRCHFEKARPDYHNAQCHKCLAFGHHQETCMGTVKCGICADAHPTPTHDCKTAGCPAGIKFKEIDRSFQRAIRAAIPWSTPRAKAKRWWTQEINELKKDMATTKRLLRANLDNTELKQHSKPMTKKWRKAIRKAQWEHWEETFHQCNKATAGKAIKVADKPKARQGLLVIQGASRFQGKCEVLRDNWPPSSLQNLSDTHNTVTQEEINIAIQSSNMDSATGDDNVSYRMIAAADIATPSRLASLFTNLLHYGAFPPAWKVAKCVPSPKPGCTDTTIAKIIDALMINLTSAQVWQSQKRKPNRNSSGTDPTRPSLLANDNDGAFNYVPHRRLIDILTNYQFPDRLIRTIKDFNQHRQIFLTFDGEREKPVNFNAGLP